MKSLFVSDLDGTLLNQAKVIPEETVLQINQFNQANEFMLATGRNLAMIKPIIEQIPSLQKVICSGGAVIYDLENDAIIKAEELKKTTIEQIYQIAKAFNISINLYSLTTVYYFKTSDRITKLLKHNEQLDLMMQLNLQQITKLSDINEVINKAVFVLPSDDIQLKQQLKQVCQKQQLNCVFSSALLLDVLPCGVDKGQAIKELQKQNNYQVVYVAGDDENDIAMLKAADIPIVVANAKEPIKKYAKLICKSNEENGIGEILTQLNNKEE